ITSDAPPGGMITITGNVVSGNKMGINLIQAGTGILVANNVVAGNSSTDIFVSQPNDVNISDNLLTNIQGRPAAEFGIVVGPSSSRVYLHDNLVENSAVTPVFYQAPGVPYR